MADTLDHAIKIVTNLQLIERVDTRESQLLADPGRVRIGDLAEQQLGTDRNHLAAHDDSGLLAGFGAMPEHGTTMPCARCPVITAFRRAALSPPGGGEAGSCIMPDIVNTPECPPIER
jgi:hypothetical protein